MLLPRKAVCSDIPQIIAWGKACQKGSHYSYPVVEEDFERNLREWIDHEDFIVLVGGDGFAIIVMAPLYFNESVWIAKELVWYSQGSGLKLIKKCIQIAKEAGCDEFHLGSQVSGREKTYKRMGFHPHGYDYVMRF